MKKLLFIAAITSYLASYSQISISTNIPSNVSFGSNIDVDVKIVKGGIGNFAKYQMDVPLGYSVFSTENKGGNFTFDEQRAKVVWVSVPSEPEFTIKLKLLVSSSAPASGTINQKFFYLENNEKREFEATPITISTAGDAIASGSNTNGGNNSSPTTSEKVKFTPTETIESSSDDSGKSTPVEIVKSTPVETVKSTPLETAKSTPAETVKSAPAETAKSSNPSTTNSGNTATVAKTNTALISETGMTFKVQLGAFSIQPNKGKFAAAGNVNIELIDGLYKVTSGNFSSRDEATKHRDNLQNKGINGFIVKYKDGKRVN